jgi:hypothetical protein
MSILIERTNSKYHEILFGLQTEHTLIGQGYFSQVYRKNSDDKHVIRICPTNELGWEVSEGWLTYFWRFICIDEAFISPHAPKVYSVTFGPNFYMVVMEVLEPLQGYGDYRKALALDFVTDVEDYGRGKTHIDLHRGNIMRRIDEATGNVTYVVTDPYA